LSRNLNKNETIIGFVAVPGDTDCICVTLFRVYLLGMPPEEIAYYMSWIPIIAGISGAIIFGYISDSLVKRGWGALGRLVVIAGMHFTVVPLIAGVVFAPLYGVFAFVFFDELLQRYFIAGTVCVCEPFRFVKSHQ
jgi:hypothetical protein